jgi:hypothetical protein
MTATPVGDWIRKRYPPNDGSTHWLGGADGDPGCCGGPHALCSYNAAFGEGQRTEQDRIRQLAAGRKATYPVRDESHVIIAHPPFADLIGEPDPLAEYQAANNDLYYTERDEGLRREGAEAEQERIRGIIRPLLEAAQAFTDATGAPELAIGFSAQAEVLTSVLSLIGEQS